MGCNILAICDEQVAYSELLVKQWLRNGDGDYRIHSFSSEEQLAAFAKKQVIDCLLVSEIYEGIEERIEARGYFCLTADKDKVLSGGDMVYVYRYQSALQIYECLMNALQQQGGKKKVQDLDFEEVQLLGVYNPVHGSGQTTFAKMLAKSCQEGGYKTLFLGMEEYVGIGNDGAEHGDLGEVIYYMKQDPKRFPIRLPNFLHHGEGYTYIEPIRMTHELKNITSEEWLQLLDLLKVHGGYEVIVLDLDSCVQGFVEILEQCSVIYMPVRMCRRGDEKRGQFFENLERLHHGDLYKKMILEELPEFEQPVDVRMKEWIEKEQVHG